MKGKRHYINTALYVRALDIAPLKGDIKPFVKNYEKIEAQVHFDKVYLETHRDMIIPDTDTIKELKKYFHKKGIRTSGGITVTICEMEEFKTYCYSNPEHRERIKGFVELTAGLFDEILFDDFFFTNCKCPLCIEAKGPDSWTNFRLRQMAEASRKLVLEPARITNPDVKVIIKYPNWYEHFQGLGFNLKEQPPLYDGIYTGTETRNAYFDTQHLQPYQSYLIFRYFQNIKPGGNRGGWVDPFGSAAIERYAQQIWMTLFAKAQEITLFDYHAIQSKINSSQRAPWQDAQPTFNFDSIISPYRDNKGQLTEAAQMSVIAHHALKYISPVLENLGNPVGIKAYKPYHSTGEDFLHNYIGMLGIPMDLVPNFPDDEPLIFLNEAAAMDPEIMERMKQQLMRGRNLIVTSGLVKALEKKGFCDISEVSYSSKKLITDTYVMGWEHITYKSKRPILIPRLMTLTNDVWEEISCISGLAGSPMLVSLRYGNGKMYILTVPDNFDDLYQLPVEILDKIRKTFNSPQYLKETPPMVSLIPYDNQTFVLASFLDKPVQAMVVIHEKVDSIKDLRTGEIIHNDKISASGQRTEITVEVEPQLFTAFKWETK